MYEQDRICYVKQIQALDKALDSPDIPLIIDYGILCFFHNLPLIIKYTVESWADKISIKSIVSSIIDFS